FFFAGRRRHTRFSRDWSSDVCSSDLNSVSANVIFPVVLPVSLTCPATKVVFSSVRPLATFVVGSPSVKCVEVAICQSPLVSVGRSEERRVGKESRRQWVRSRERVAIA